MGVLEKARETGTREAFVQARIKSRKESDKEIEEMKEIDHYFQDSIRYVLYGSMKKRNRRISHEKLNELGYRSLVYYYYHLDEIEGIA